MALIRQEHAHHVVPALALSVADDGAATQRRSLQSTFGPYQETVKIALVHLDVEGEFDRAIDAIQATDVETKNDLADLDSDEEMTRRAFELLSSKPHNNYERALAALREDTRHWWAATLARA